MIGPTKRKLTTIFSVVIISFCVLVLGVGFYFHHRSILEVLHNKMLDSEKKEFIAHFFYGDLDDFSQLREDEVFQVIDSTGQIVVTTEGHESFPPQVHAESLAAAKAGEDKVLMVKTETGESFTMLYFQLNENYVGRIVMNLGHLKKYDQTFLLLALAALPGCMLISFLISHYLVNLVMKPITGAFQFQENFSSNVAHELLTPLTTLKGNLELALRKKREPADYEEFIGEALTESDRIIHLLRDLHLLASAKFKPMELQKNKVDLLAILGESLAQYEPLLHAAGLDVEPCDLGDQKAQCPCDAQLIRRVFDNLLENAVKYAAGEKKFSLSFQTNNKQVIFTFKNSTMPIKNQELRQLTEPFFRAANAVDSPARGKGLGLNLVNYIVQSHGGELRLALEPENIFSATVVLPLEPSRPAGII